MVSVGQCGLWNLWNPLIASYPHTKNDNNEYVVVS